MKTFQDIIISLQNFWTKKNCILQQGYDLESGAGTFNPETFLRCIGPEPYNICNVEICRRPTDGRYGKNPNRLQKFHQFQVIAKPSPLDFQQLYLDSLEAIGFNLNNHDIRFVHDDWESPTQGAWGLGWEVWCDGMEITQFTYFQSIGGHDVNPVAGELAYGLERIAMFLQNKTNVYDIAYNDTLSYGDVFLQGEVESCHYNFEIANVEMLTKHFEDFENESKRMIEQGHPTLAYDFAVRASHTFNLLDARSAISTTARVGLMHRIRDLCCEAAKLYLETRKEMNFPLLKKEASEEPALPEMQVDPKVGPSTRDDFLFEIGSEEIPAKFIPSAVESLEKNIRALFKEKGLEFDLLEMFGTPRRLAVYMKKVVGGTATTTVERKGPSIDIAFGEDGTLTKQGRGFMSSLGLDAVTKDQVLGGEIKQLSLKEGKHLIAHVEKKGEATTSILQEALPGIIKNIAFMKKMRWNTRTEAYARPVRWLTAMYGKNVIPISFAGVVSSNLTYGHSQIDPKEIKLAHPKHYKKKLLKHWVIASVKDRKAHIEKQLNSACSKLGTSLPQKDRVLSEVLYLSEYPTIGISDFEEKYLELPPELLISEMIDHQRYFPLFDRNGKLIPKFLVAVDKKPTDLILHNNAAVLRARLNDGFFLFDQDLKRPLESFNEDLKHVVFHKDLGSTYEKSVRVKEWAEKIAGLLGLNAPSRAAELCKADLATAVVYEFPDLQGVIGKYYALKEGESEDVATAISEHWWPLTEGGSIPTTESGHILALADKFDNLESYMKIGIKPSSSKDPYALRRSAIGILRILIEGKYSLSLSKVASPEVISFILQRLRNILYDHGFAKEEVEAVISSKADDPYDLYCRARALHEFRKSSSDFDTLHQVYKRARGQIENESAKNLDTASLQDEHEKNLSRGLEEVKPLFRVAIEEKDYSSAFKALVPLSSPLTQFFENVRVLDDDQKVRDNRIALLQEVFHITSNLVDLNKL